MSCMYSTTLLRGDAHSPPPPPGSWSCKLSEQNEYQDSWMGFLYWGWGWGGGGGSIGDLF